MNRKIGIQSSSRRRSVISVIFLLAYFFPSISLAQYLPVVLVKWSLVTTQEDGAAIDSSDLSYSVYNSETEERMCNTAGLECTFEIAWSECVTLHATSTQTSTTLESKPSNTIDVCAEARPEFQPTPPIIEVIIQVFIDGMSAP